jgi:DNA mismatch endonuclease, patch repair protein
MSQKQTLFAKLLKSRGLKFEEEVRELPGTPDIFFREKKLAVFFHGCYWHNHGCGNQVTNPITASQRAARALTDQAQQAELLEHGYKYLIVWECDFDKDPSAQVRKVLNRLHFS